MKRFLTIGIFLTVLTVMVTAQNTFSGLVKDTKGQAIHLRVIEKAWNPTTVSQDIVSVNPDDVYLFYSIGRTWTVKLKVDF